MSTHLKTPATLGLSRAPRSKLAQTCAQQLLEEIRSQKLVRGTRLPSERELMSVLGVGRSTVREAINGLAMLGVVEIRHGQGVFVADGSAGQSQPDAIAVALARGVTPELFEARRIVEIEAARLAGERRTKPDIRDLERCLSDHERALAVGEPGVGPSVRFHLCVAAAAHNELLAAFVTLISETLAERGPMLEAKPGFREWEIGQHRSIFEPIRAGDAEAAAVAMRAHIDAVFPHHAQIGLSS